MKIRRIIAFAAIIGIAACSKPGVEKELLNSSDLERVVLVGGSLISTMEDYGYFEYSLIRHFQSDDVSIRNVAWPADDVFGLARSQFGSAQNTQSWQPPNAEEGFGSKVLMEHIKEATPKSIIIGYGPEVAFYETEEEFDLFKSGYERLLTFADKESQKLILISPSKQEKAEITAELYERRNENLKKAADFIAKLAKDNNCIYVNLYDQLVEDPSKLNFTRNGVQLNEKGYRKMNKILLESLGINETEQFTLNLDQDGSIVSEKNVVTDSWAKTLRGASFNVKPNEMLYKGEIRSKEPIAIYANGALVSNVQDTILTIFLRQDSLRQDRVIKVIKEKNRLYRYRLRPLNEAYIYLFRKHEMGHLAYEMDDLQNLVLEKEKEINRLKTAEKYDIEIELIKPWKSPKNYPEDEVPANVPEPNIPEEIAAFNISEGYEIELFAADPMISNPININWDNDGRAWVATSSTYPHIVPGREPNDKIVILEDTNNDGKADKHTVFAENLLVPHSVMPVKGGAYVLATTQLLFLADTNGDDIADERRVIIDGFGNADIHHTIHGLRWTPWGDLHFTQSIYINSFLETINGQKILNGSGTWAFRPESEGLEVFSRGLVNPWGEAFDQWGQAFATDGAGGSGINYIFPESAHATAVGAKQVLEGLNSGTPKNTGADVIYSSHFPKEWQGTIISSDFRANRTVRYQLSPDKSGYTSKEVETILHSDHRSYRPVDTKIGPDGSLYVVDWYNPIIDHGEVDFHHPVRDKTHGRVWRFKKKGKKMLPVAKMNGQSPEFLLNQLKSSEQITRLRANRAFVEQSEDPQLVVNWVKGNSNAQQRIEGLWLLAALNHYQADLLRQSLQSNNYNERAAAVRLVAHYHAQEEHFELLSKLISDSNAQVRLETLHTLRSMGGSIAAETAIKVLDADMDTNLDYALSFTLDKLRNDWLSQFNKEEGIFDGDLNKQLYALLATEDQRIIPHLNTILKTGSIDSELEAKAWRALAKIGDSETKGLVLEKAIKEENHTLLIEMSSAPKIYDAIPSNLELLRKGLEHDSLSMRVASINLAERWKTDQFQTLISEIGQSTSHSKERLAAFGALMSVGEEEKIKDLAQNDPKEEIRVAASIIWLENDAEAALGNSVQLLQSLTDPELGEQIFRKFRSVVGGPKLLEEALQGITISEDIANVGLKVVQTSGLNLPGLDAAIRASGNIKPLGMSMTFEEKNELIEAARVDGNVSRGRAIYRRKDLLCATCHRIGNAGGLSGPPLTTIGSFMTPNSILESVLNPSSDIKQNFETMIINKTDGEVFGGVLHRKTNTSTMIRQSDGQIIEIPNSEIASTEISPGSLMPIGLTRDLSREELRDLMKFLMSLGVEN